MKTKFKIAIGHVIRVPSTYYNQGVITQVIKFILYRYLGKLRTIISYKIIRYNITITRIYIYISLLNRKITIFLCKN